LAPGPRRHPGDRRHCRACALPRGPGRTVRP
jgi:hypothetical protein